MSFIKRYIRIHISALRILYHKILSHTDKNVFVFLFNLRSWLYQNGSSVSWDGSNFVISDKTITDFPPNAHFNMKCNRYCRVVPGYS